MATQKNAPGANNGQISDSAGIRPYKLDNKYATTALFLAAKSKKGRNAATAEADDNFYNTTENAYQYYNGTAWLLLEGVDAIAATALKGVIFAAAPDAVSGTAACSIANYYTTLTSSGASVPTLADGTVTGQLKKIQMIVDDTNNAVLTPANLNGGTTVTFADVGDTAELVWDGSAWQVIALYNIVDGATAPVLG